METGGAAPGSAPAALRGLDIGNWADRTPIHDAARHGYVLQLQQLIDSGVCVNLFRVDSITPLHEAALHGHTKCVKLLLAAGKPECVKLLIDVGANLEAHDCHFGTPLHVACAMEHLDCAKALLNAGIWPYIIHHFNILTATLLAERQT
ncbi:hypothetical protein FKM82_012938 [Ascaphus truei]